MHLVLFVIFSLLLCSLLFLLPNFHRSLQLLCLDLPLFRLDISLAFLHQLARLADICTPLPLKLLLGTHFTCLTVTPSTLHTLLFLFNNFLALLLLCHPLHLFGLFIPDAIFHLLA